MLQDTGLTEPVLAVFTAQGAYGIHFADSAAWAYNGMTWAFGRMAKHKFCTVLRYIRASLRTERQWNKSQTILNVDPE